MTDVLIRYNPYTVKTELSINGTEITSKSPLIYAADQRLQTWIEPHGHWNGIFSELKKQTGEKQIQVRFHGTAYDYADLEYASEKYGGAFERADLFHINKDTCGRSGQEDKLKQLKVLYQELQDGPIEEFKTEEIQKAFQAAIDTDFKIVVVAPMSSGKSTLINAMLGRDLLPALAEATTAVITTIRDNDDMDQFEVTARDAAKKPIRFRTNADGTYAETQAGGKEASYILDPDGRAIEHVPADAGLIQQLNAALDPADPSGKCALASSIEIEGPIPAFPSSRLKTVFVDTPGGSYARNEEHKRLMDEAIQDEEKSLILFIFNGTQTGTNDSEAILRQIAEEMQRSSNGKQSRDRFLFVANRMDDFDPEKEPYREYVKNAILPDLARHGIQGPNLFLVSARLAKLLRMRRNGETLTKKDRSDLAGMLASFGDMSDGDGSCCLYQFSSITDRQKADFSGRIQALLGEAEKPSMDEIAEINSGVPALEWAIRDYLEKYAVSIKIKNAHDTFMRKVKSRKMVDEREAAWASSKHVLEEVNAEIQEKRKAYRENQRLAEFKAGIDQISIDKKQLLAYEARLTEKVDRFYRHSQSSIRRDQAKAVLMEFEQNLKNAWSEVGREVVACLNGDVLKRCGEVIDEYTAYVKELGDSGLLDLGGIKVQELEGFEDLAIDSVNSMLNDEDYIYEEEIEGAPRRYKKDGILNAIKRLFGIDSGWGTVRDKENVKFIKIRDLIQVKISESLDLFHEELDNSIRETEKQVNEVKGKAHKRLDRLNQRMDQLLKELEEKTSDMEQLKAEVEANAKNLQWMKDFVGRVDTILEIE